MTDSFILNAEIREDQGKGASRRLRRLEGKVPAIIYGGKSKKPQALSLRNNEVAKAVEQEAFFSHILTLQIGDKEETAIIKDMQRHPSTGNVTHMDFMRVSKGQAITVNVPLHFINEDNCVGVKMEGGKITHQIVEIEISCLPKNLPEFIDVDMSDVHVETVLHMSDIALPEGVTIVALTHGEDHDLPIAAIHKPKGQGEDDEDEGGEEATEAEGGE